MGYTTLYTDASREGREVVLSLVRVAEIHGPAHYAVEKGALRFEVRGPTAELLVGSEVSIGGVWRGAQGGLEQTWVEDRTDGRRGKRWLGGVGLLLVFGVFGTSVRWTREGLALRG